VIPGLQGRRIKTSRSAWATQQDPVSRKKRKAGCLATQEAEIRRIVVRSQPRQIVCETLSQISSLQKRVGGVAQV
jgi:hypothetical protein